MGQGRLVVDCDVIVQADGFTCSELEGPSVGTRFDHALFRIYPDRAAVISSILTNHALHGGPSLLLLWSDVRPGLRSLELGACADGSSRFEVRWTACSEESRRDLLLTATDWALGNFGDDIGLRFWETDKHHRFTVVTDSPATGGAFPPARVMTGRTRWEVAGVNDPSTSSFWHAHRTLLDAHRPFSNFEYVARSEDGESTTWCVSGRPRFDGAGEFLGYAGTVYTAAAPASTAASSPAGHKGQVTDNPMMLVVDDQRPVRRSVKRMFQRMGWDVAEADCGHAAIAALTESPRTVDLVVSDVVMPGGMDGIALADLIRKRFPDTAVVLVSGHRPREWNGPVEILEKPFSEATILEAARRSGLPQHLCLPNA